MAEVVGTVSAAAGLVGFSGQILQGCLFAKTFFDDARNAPKEIRRILNELEILEASAEKTRRLFEQVDISHTIIEKRDFEPSLKLCVDNLTRLGDILKEVSRKFEGKGATRWWEMMKTAARTKVVNGQLAGLERAKSQLSIVQQNISIALKHHDRAAFAKTSSSVSSIQTATTEIETKVDQILVKDTEILSAVHKTDQQLAIMSTNLQEIQSSSLDAEILSTVKKTDHEVTAISTNLQEIRSQIESQSSTMATAEMANKISIQNDTIIYTTQETNQAVTSISSGVAQATSQLQNLTSALGYLQSPMNLENVITSAVSKALAAHKEMESNKASSKSQQLLHEDFPSFTSWNEAGRPRQQRTKVLAESQYNAGLFRIEVKTVENIFEIVDADSAAIKQGSHLKRTYQIIPNTLFMSRGFILDYCSNPKLGNCGIQIQTVNIIPLDSPIFNACREFDVDEVRRLFDCGLASPSDRDIFENSPLDIILNETTYLIPGHCDYFQELERFQSLFRFLIEFGGQSNCSVNKISIYWFICCELNRSFECPSWKVDMLRVLLGLIKEDPFTENLTTRLLTLSTSEHPISRLICQQEFWYLDLSPISTYCWYLEENDRHIVDDISGERLKKFLSENPGAIYTIVENSYVCYSLTLVKQRICQPYNKVSIFNALLRLIAESNRIDVREGCWNRLITLLKNDWKILGVEFPVRPHRLQLPWNKIIKLTKGCDGRLLSPTNYAQNLGLGKLWYDALLEVGMASEEVENIFDDEYYIGVPELLDQTRPFLARDECRQMFLEYIITGKFAKLSKVQIIDQIIILLINLGFTEQGFAEKQASDLFEMILEANTAFNQKFMPGSWLECEEIRLVPGLDFSWHESKRNDGFSWETILMAEPKP